MQLTLQDIYSVPKQAVTNRCGLRITEVKKLIFWNKVKRSQIIVDFLCVRWS